MIESFNDINISFMLNNIKFDMRSIEIEKSNFNVYGSIKITTKTETCNYLALSTWVGSFLNATSKSNLNFFDVHFYGVFPIDYTFNQYSITVTFSADYFTGDISNFKQRYIRKEKLKRLEKVSCQYQK